MVSIPFIAGQWSLLEDWLNAGSILLVSIPFIAGQWSLLGEIVSLSDAYLSFNPLHCGAVVASLFPNEPDRRVYHVSIPIIAGQWSLPVNL